ncbi:hypothetical protein LPJ61_003997, partial [Coemansia biformis]
TDSIPVRRPTSNIAVPWIRMAAGVLSRTVLKHAFLSLYLDKRYMEVVRRDMVPLVLARVIKAVNEQDRDICEQIMVPGLAKQYECGLDELRDDDSSLCIEASDVRDPRVEGLDLLIGASAAFDTSVPRAIRESEFEYMEAGSFRCALARSVASKQKSPTLMPFSERDPIRLVVHFNVTANIEIVRTRRGEVVDRDAGEMVVPLSLSTPDYQTLTQFPIIGADGRIATGRKQGPPFEWRVADTFRILASKEETGYENGD